MKDAQKPDHVSLNTLIAHLAEGRFRIPDFQREFEWKPWDINELMRSIFLDYYIGSLLLWKAQEESFDALACEPVYGADQSGNPEHIVLDGQQRLTAIYYTFLAPDVPLPNRANRFRYLIRVDRFMEGAYDEAFDYDWTQWMGNLLRDKNVQYESHIFPLAVIGEGGWALANWAQGYEQHWRSKAQGTDGTAREEATRRADDARAFGKHLKGITEQYQIAYIELDRDLELDKVCDIFTQINSRGVRLDIFDLFNALLKPKGLQLKHMWRQAEPALDFVETERMNVYILQVMSILKQAYCSPKYLYYLLPKQQKTVREPDGALRKEILVKDVVEFASLWANAVGAVRRAIDLLRHPQEFGAISSAYLPYVSILPVFAALGEEIRSMPPHQQLDARRKLSHWYWASVFTNRYSGSVESTSARDFLDLRSWFADDDQPPALLREFAGRFRTLDLRREVKRGTSMYNGIFNLLVLRGARDWMTGNVPQYGDLDDHHIVPKDWGKDHGLAGLVDSILNRTPLTADTNRHVIGNRLPNQYLPELIAENGEKSVRVILESHFISPAAFDILVRDPFTPDDFEAFLMERQRTLTEGIESLLIKERLDLSPRLRELDEQLEQLELALRHLVVGELEEDVARMPHHVLAKAKERLDGVARKSPGFDANEHDTLAGLLQYCDIRELQDTISNKTLWPLFQPWFLNKETLAMRFGQAATLRNAIRHSRAADEVARKDGEAALGWFDQAINRRSEQLAVEDPQP